MTARDRDSRRREIERRLTDEQRRDLARRERERAALDRVMRGNRAWKP